MKRVGGWVMLVAWACVLSGGAVMAQEAGAAPPLKIAAICTAYQPFLHADVIVSKFLLGFPTDEGLLPPQVTIASLYIDRGPADSLGRQLAARFGIPVFDTIEEALTLGGKTLAVDGVLLIGEHGSYPKNQYGQVMYPRMLMLARIFRVFEWSGRVAPVFCDKQLSYDWTNAKWMYDRARELKVPMMAGSVIPLAWRDPPDFQQPRDAKISEAVVLYAGDLDRYAIHGLELLQSLVERRQGGETGVRRVECVQQEEFDRAAAEGRIPLDLVDAALRAHAGFSLAERPLARSEYGRIAILIEYADGMRACVLMVNRRYTQRWLYAARTEGTVATCEFRYLPEGVTSLVQPVPLFSYLGLNVQQMFLTGRPQYPLERTLLTTGVAAVAVHSLHQQQPLDTPFLDVRYQPFDFEPIRPAGRQAAGASLAPWPPLEEMRPLFKWRNDP